ncbi:MAG: hypothetical protein WCK05_16705, partial [Planctomycetota bacterium]
MHGKTRNTLLGYGLSTDLVGLIDGHGDNVGTLQAMPVAELKKRYGDENATVIGDRLKRKPIEPEAVAEVLRLSGGCCCYCADGNAVRPYQIHHIGQYSETQDHSLNNLLVVCPTHHVVIHSTAIPSQEQLRVRDAWYAVQAVANAYAHTGVTFPFGTFEAISYIGTARSESLFVAPVIDPPTAVAITQHKLGDLIEGLLHKHRFALVAGISGCGKTTCAIGVAGRPSFAGRSVFLHRGIAGVGSQIRAEILAFFTLAKRPCILILDNANRWASGDVLDAIARAVPAHVSVLVTWSDAESPSDLEALNVHVLGLRVTLTWNAIYQTVLALLASHEVEVVKALNPILSGAKEHTLEVGGVGPFLSQRMAEYAAKARTAWEFVFLMRAGWSEVEQ